ncbi:hypothetical protein CEUSTIGMA_g857.t1 [Chlamydomonas eustigma]|uniref:microtubule-severing ATPase n=1 Tax=Chlamydomonas eustigma TaxID=1157962 RepID=A0A250WRD6_9CHLO|nr:hypothetical protein CEUSTIGMA_g857.t1 [Chlamydomonas eustigma]|eukprot:GAX73405.1 hypothetical protein CEUSTIGMA_g857.t1 [Chlamydomonas eustigma]
MAMKWLGLGSAETEPKQLPPREKLKALYDLAKEAVESAYTCDVEGKNEKALKLYQTGIQAIEEALKLPVQGSGLGPKADNISSWKHDLIEWEAHVKDRIRYLEAGSAASSSSAPPPFRPQRNLAVSSATYQPPYHSTSSPAATMTLQGAANVTNRGGFLGSWGAGSSLLGAAGAALTSKPKTGRSSGGGSAAAAHQGSGVAAASRSSSVTRGTGAPGYGAKAAEGGGVHPRPGSAHIAGAAPAPASTSTSGREDQRYRDMVLSEIMDKGPKVTWEDVAGLRTAKQALIEAVVLPTLRADLFKGLRAPVRGILLYGPPGNGKTLLGKALAHEASACFFAISASSLTSKWVGDGEKLVRALFQVASERAPSIIFIDEIDSILSSRSSGENDAMRRLKTEFLVQFDGVAGGDDRVMVVGATNRPAELDDAVRRRLAKRIYIPLPDDESRTAVLKHLLKGQVGLSSQDLEQVVRYTDGYSASDLTALCKEAAMGPIRELDTSQLSRIAANSIRSIGIRDFGKALRVIKPSCDREALAAFEEWTRQFGTQ